MSEPMLNPSYFAPYKYRIFAKLDCQHNWLSVVDTSYDVLNQASNLSRIKLPPDWCTLSPDTGKVSINENDKNSDYSYDAIRVPWRISLDWQWNHEIRAKNYLKRLSFLQQTWKQKHTIYASYTARGVPRERASSLASFGCILPQFAILAPDMAQQILRERLIPQYNHGLWHQQDDYYGQNWAWFGIALMFDKLNTPQFPSKR
jgi:endoglucanase